MASPRSRATIRPTVTAGLILIVAGATAALVASLSSNSATTVSIESLGATDALATQHITVVDFDPFTGRPVSPPKHSPIRFLKRIDNTSIPLRAALSDQQLFRNVTLDYLRFNRASGHFDTYYLVTLSHATVVRIETVLSPSLNDVLREPQPLEAVELAFERIEVEFPLPEPPDDDPPDGDGDYSGRVDLRDFAGLQRCFDPKQFTSLSCDIAFDLNFDNLVDWGDRSYFNAAMTGP